MAAIQLVPTVISASAARAPHLLNRQLQNRIFVKEAYGLRGYRSIIGLRVSVVEVVGQETGDMLDII